MKYKSWLRLLSLFFAMAIPVGFTACSQPVEVIPEPVYTIKLTSPEDRTTVDLCAPYVRQYLELEDPDEIALFLRKYSNIPCDYMATSFTWEGDGSATYTVTFADNPNFENAFTYQTEACILEHRGIFIPGKTYWWKVTGSNPESLSPTGTFTALDAPVRYITTDESWNIRDIGGWKTADGKTVKYGMMYRGGKTNTAGRNEGPSAEDIRVFTELLGLRSELDLRFINIDDDGQSKSVYGEDIHYWKLPIQPYSYIIPSFHVTTPVDRRYDPMNAISLERIFRYLADANNYPILFHCTAGADRTGTLALLINGLLGVSREDLTRDFELTSFSVAQARWRSSISRNNTFDIDGKMYDTANAYVGWDAFIDDLLREYGTADGTLSSAIENYLITVCDVKPEQIDALRHIMLE